MKSQFMAQQFVQYTTLWICSSTKDKFHKSVLFYPQCIMQMDKTGVYKLYKNENMVCYLDQFFPIGL